MTTDTASGASPAGPAPSTARRGGSIFSARAWAELLYALVTFPLTIAFFVATVTLIAVGGGLTLIYVGIAVLLFGLLLARVAGATFRGLAASLLDMSLPAPGPVRRRHPGFVGAIRDRLTDVDAWRAFGCLCGKMAMAPATFAIAVFFYSGLGAVSYPIWRPFLPAQLGPDGQWHRGTQLWNGFFLDTWPTITIQVVAGVALLIAAPYALRGILSADRNLMRSLLTARPEPAAAAAPGQARAPGAAPRTGDPGHYPPPAAAAPATMAGAAPEPEAGAPTLRMERHDGAGT